MEICRELIPFITVFNVDFINLIKIGKNRVLIHANVTCFKGCQIIQQ